ncbi:hypothetical protein H0X06_02840 [Candidatus Dependentiae bacterium]|nr:hypothetical protein [Candidatus Dependentiae bacterium]
MFYKKVLPVFLAVLPLVSVFARVEKPDFYSCHKKKGFVVPDITRQARGAASAKMSQDLYNCLAEKCTKRRYSFCVCKRCDNKSYFTSSYSVCSSIAPIEKLFLSRRMQRVKQSLESFIGISIEESSVPLIGACFGGGGCRALLQTAGWLGGAERIGLFDTLCYMSGLSGSTWALNSLVASGLSPTAFKQQLAHRLELTIAEHMRALLLEDKDEISIVLAKKVSLQRPMSVVDDFGILLARIFLKGLVANPYSLSLFDLSYLLFDGNYPFPLSTATSSVVKVPQKRRLSFEFSPLFAGSFELSSFVSTRSFGALYDKGVVQSNSDYSESLGFVMGLCGSAFALDLNSVIEEFCRGFLCTEHDGKKVGKNEAIISAFKGVACTLISKLGERLGVVSSNQHRSPKTIFMREQWGAASCANFAKGLYETSVGSIDSLVLVDAGFEVVDSDRLCLGIMPLLYRGVNLIYVVGTARDYNDVSSLRAAEKKAHLLGLKFPPITYESIGKTGASVFIDEDDLKSPIIVYMPGRAHQGYSLFDPAQEECTRTLNFTYTQREAEALMGLSDFIVGESKEILRYAGKRAVERKMKENA